MDLPLNVHKGNVADFKCRNSNIVTSVSNACNLNYSLVVAKYAQRPMFILKEITNETSHLPPLKHRLIRACVIGQEPLSATNQSTQDIRH